MLKSATDWIGGKTVTDPFGFSVLPAGRFWDHTGLIYEVGRNANFWSSTVYDAYFDEAYYVEFDDYHDGVSLDKKEQNIVWYSVRCVKD